MVLRHHHLHFVAEHRNHFHIARGLRQRDDAQVHGAFLHFLQNLVAEIPVNRDLDLRVKLLEARESLRKNVKAGGFVGADEKLAARRLVELRDGLQSLFL